MPASAARLPLRGAARGPAGSRAVQAGQLLGGEQPGRRVAAGARRLGRAAPRRASGADAEGDGADSVVGAGLGRRSSSAGASWRPAPSALFGVEVRTVVPHPASSVTASAAVARETSRCVLRGAIVVSLSSESGATQPRCADGLPPLTSWACPDTVSHAGHGECPHAVAGPRALPERGSGAIAATGAATVSRRRRYDDGSLPRGHRMHDRGATDPDPTRRLPPRARRPRTEPVTLRLGVYGDKAMREAYEKLARVYNNDHPDVTVEVEHTRPAGEGRRAARAAVLRRRRAGPVRGSQRAGAEAAPRRTACSPSTSCSRRAG